MKHNYKYISLVLLASVWLIGCAAGVKDKSLVSQNDMQKIAQDKAYEYFTNGTVQEEAGDFHKAIVNYQIALMYDPFSTTLTLALSRCYTEIGEVEPATFVLEALLEHNPNDLEALEVLYVQYAKRALLLPSISVLNRIAKIRPLTEIETLRIAEMYRRTQQIDLAISVLNKYQENNQPTANIYEEIGKLHLAKRDVANAEIVFEKLIALTPTDHRIHFILGGFAISRNEYEKAEKYFRTAIMYDNTKQDYWTNLIGALAMQQKIEEILELSEEIFEIFPDNARMYSSMSSAAIQLSHFDKAIEILNQGIEALPDEVGFYVQLGFVYHKNGDWVNSAEVYQKALDMNPEDAQLLNNYAYMLSEANMNLEVALEMSKKAVEQEPKLAAYRDTLGWIYYRMGMYQEAHDEIKLSLDISGENAEVLGHFGHVLLMLGKDTEAKEAFQKASVLEPSNEEYRELAK